jgi:hypothetical protein
MPGGGSGGGSVEIGSPRQCASDAVLRRSKNEWERPGGRPSRSAEASRSQGTAHPPDVRSNPSVERFLDCLAEGAHPVPSSSTTDRGNTSWGVEALGALNWGLPGVLSLPRHVKFNATSFRWLLLASLALMTTLCTEAQQTRPIVNLFVDKGRLSVGAPLTSRLKRPPVVNSIDTTLGQATIENGQVTGVRITNRGRYPLNAKLGVVFSGGGGSGAVGVVETRTTVSLLDGRSSWQEITGVRISNPGSGYTSPPVVAFVFQ